MSEEVSKRNRGRPKRASGQGKEELLKAALELFSRKGYDGTNTREIAEKAGVDVALIGHHFGSKMQLWQSVIDYIAGSFIAKFNEKTVLAYEEKNFREHVINLLDNFVDLAFLVPELSKLITIEAVESERLSYMVGKLFRPIRTVIIKLIKEGMKQGVFAVQDEEVLFTMVVGATTYQIANAQVMKNFSNLPATPDSWKKEIKRSLISNFIKE